MLLEGVSGTSLLSQTVFHLFSMSHHLTTRFLLLLQNISYIKKSDVLASTSADKYLDMFVHVGFLSPTQPSKCRSVLVYCWILLLLHLVLWVRNDRNKAILKHEGENIVLISIIRVMVKVFVIVTIISIITLIAMVAV